MHVSLLLQFVVGSTQKWRRMTGLNMLCYVILSGDLKCASMLLLYLYALCLCELII